MKKVRENKTNNKGFTLVELIIVIAIIAMLIAMIAPNLTSFLDTASETTVRANAKTAYTSVNAWVTQQRVAGVALDDIAADNPLVVKKNGDALQIKSFNGVDYTNQANYATIVNLFNAGEFNEGSTNLEIVLTADYKVTKVTWYEGSESANYPQ